MLGTINEAAVWGIIGLPLVGGLLVIAGMRPWRVSLWPWTGVVSIGAMAGAAGVRLWGRRAGGGGGRGGGGLRPGGAVRHDARHSV